MKYFVVLSLLVPSAFGWYWQASIRGSADAKPWSARFTDIASTSGLSKPSVYGPANSKNYILETTGCGVAFVDFNNDGWLDILVLGGTRFQNPPKGPGNHLYRNDGKGHFTDVTESMGLTKTGWASSVTIGDFDNDGYEDLFLTYWGQNVLYRWTNGKYEDVTRKAGLFTKEGHWSSGASFLDYDRDGKLDLFVTEYLVFDPAKIAKPSDAGHCNWKGVAVNCGPRGLPLGHHKLYHNKGNGVFEDVTEASGVGNVQGVYGMSVAAADFDGDGWIDIYVASDSTPSQLLMNQKNGTFLEQGLARGVAVSDDGMEQAGMGAAVGDFFREGRLSLFKTNFADDASNLYRNLGKGFFADEVTKSGLAVETRFMNWGAGGEDFDNDGWPDIFFAGGNVFPEVERTLPNYPHKTPRILFRGLGGGRFEQISASAGPALAQRHSSRGVAFGDFDNDGDMDILIFNMNEAPSLLRNDLAAGGRHWMKVQLEGTESNRSAIGATVIATFEGRPLAKAVTSQESFYSVNDRRLHFGLGSAKKADLQIHWPSGRVEKLAGLVADRLHFVREGQGVTMSKSFQSQSEEH